MIGVLDSGVGGLSVLRELRTLLPSQDLVYIGDSAFCPYGNKSTAILRERVGGIVETLINQGAEVIVLACNSATIQAIHWCRQQWPRMTFVGMEPGIKPAVNKSASGIIGVLATEASLTGEMFAQLVERYGASCEIITQACPRFVDLVENGQITGEEVRDAITEYIAPLIIKKADTLVLGCTHYPFLKKEIEKLYPQLIIIDTGIAVARRVKDMLPAPSSEGSGTIKFYTSSSPESLENILPLLVPELGHQNAYGLNLQRD